jgi:hypothetical protein
MGAGTEAAPGGDTTTNACGIANQHAYSIVEAFTLKQADGTSWKMLLMRNPWGTSGYKGAWSETDSRWDSYTKS